MACREHHGHSRTRCSDTRRCSHCSLMINQLVSLCKDVCEYSCIKPFLPSFELDIPIFLYSPRPPELLIAAPATSRRVCLIPLLHVFMFYFAPSARSPLSGVSYWAPHSVIGVVAEDCISVAGLHRGEKMGNCRAARGRDVLYPWQIIGKKSLPSDGFDLCFSASCSLFSCFPLSVDSCLYLSEKKKKLEPAERKERWRVFNNFVFG
jgi:hypothetical protein